MRRLVVREAVWVALLVVIAGVWGARYVQRWRAEGRPQIFYQQYFEPALMIACGRGFVAAAQPSAAVEAFVSQRADRFSCADLPAAIDARAPETTYQYAWFYLMWMVGLYWAIAGVSWSGLVPLFGVLFAVSVSLAYAIARVVVPWWAALPAAAFLAASPLHLQNLPHLRDYSKAPFVLGLLLILLVLVRSGASARRIVGWSAVYGGVLGIAYGVRTDFLANIPPLIVTVLAFVPGFRLKDVAVKAAALVVAAAAFAAMSWPVVSYVTQRGGCQWHVVLLGLEHNFNDNLGVAPSYYQWISRYSDEYVLTSVNSYRVRTEAGAPVPFCASDYDAASGDYLVRIATTVPGDVVTRAYASALRIADLPFYLWTTVPGTAPQYSPAGQVMSTLVGTARLGVVVGVLMLAGVGWRYGWFALFVVLYFGGYPMLQFADRHFFHLEVIGALGMAMVFTLLVQVAHWLRGRRQAPWGGDGASCARRVAWFAAVTVGALVAPLPALRAHQDASVTQMTGRLLAAPRVDVATVVDPTTGDVLVADPRGLADPADPTATAYLDLTLDPRSCAADVPIGVRYDRSDPFRDYSAAIVPQPREASPSRILIAVFAGFEGFSLGGRPAACVTRVQRLASVAGQPLLPTLTLPDDWRDRPPHQRIGRMALRLWGMGN